MEAVEDRRSRRGGLAAAISFLIAEKWGRRQVLVVCLILTVLPIVARLVLLPIYPIPRPAVADEFGYLLLADTFASGRLANPPHPLQEHFETLYVLQQPHYASIYPPGQGVALAVGQASAGHPWYGVVASTGLLCGAIFWMLCGWVEPPWALLGALYFFVRLGVFSYWTNSYMGGNVAAIGGAIALGALPRLIKSSRVGTGVTLAVGLAITVMSRPFEGLLFSGAVGLILLAWMFRGGRLRFVAAPVAVIALLTVALQGYYNYRVTGHALQMPYQLSQAVYGVPRGLVWEPLPPEPKAAYKDIRDVYEWQKTEYVPLRERWNRIWSFYGGFALALGIILSPFTRKKGSLYLAGVCIFVVLGQYLYWFFLPHYVAPLTSAFLGISVLGLRYVWNWRVLRMPLRRALVAGIVLLDMFLSVKAGMQVVGGPELRAFSRERSKIEDRVNSTPGNHLILVRVGPDHNAAAEWIYNRADIDRARIVWARELDDASNARVREYFKNRSVWLVKVDADPIRLTRLADPSETARAIQ